MWEMLLHLHVDQNPMMMMMSSKYVGTMLLKQGTSDECIKICSFFMQRLKKAY